MRITKRLLVFLSVLGIGLASATADPKVPTNLGLAAYSAITHGTTTVILVREISSGTDLNGDGDTYDQVLVARDGATGTNRNLGLAVGSYRFDGRYVACLVPEFSQGGTDLNGDGDAFDFVLHVHDVRLGTTRNLGIASVYEYELNGGVIATRVSEYQQGGTDLNGDGDTYDQVLHVHDARSGTTTNMKLATYSPKTDGRFVAFSVFEAQQGGADLNGDGDTFDAVMHVHDTVTGKTGNLAVAGLQVDGIDSGLLLFRASEGAQGADLNGDGDASDLVPIVFHANAGKLVPLAVSSSGAGVLEDGIAAVTVSEFATGQDLNGDGDLYDTLLAVYDAASGKLTRLGLAILGSFEIEARRVAFGAYEYAQGGTDLNGDGDGFDLVVHLYDADKGTTKALAAGGLVAVRGHDVCFYVTEYSEGGADRNGDGDAYDRVLHVYDAASGSMKNLGLAIGTATAGTSRVLLQVSEYAQGGTDLNGDGDATDSVVYVLALPEGTVRSTGLAGLTYGFEGAGTPMLAFTVSELGQGQDLNGDGDLIDHVVHVIE